MESAATCCGTVSIANDSEAQPYFAVYFSQSPVLWLTVTLLVYATTNALSLVTHRHPLANPVLHSIWIIGAFLMLTGTSYTTYFGGAQFVHFLLGPATVALAVPLYENRKVVAAAILPMLASRWASANRCTPIHR